MEIDFCEKCNALKSSEKHQKHLVKSRERSKKRRDRCKELKLCISHPNNSANGGRCQECLDKVRSREKENVNNGNCCKHPKEKLFVGGRCKNCWMRQMLTSGIAQPITNEIISKAFELLELQEYKCIYTGKELIPGKNLSLDHIMPISRGGELSFENIQFIDLEINTRYKRDLTHYEFMGLCRLASKKIIKNKYDEYEKTLANIWNYQVKLFRDWFLKFHPKLFLEFKDALQKSRQ